MAFNMQSVQVEVFDIIIDEDNISNSAVVGDIGDIEDLDIDEDEEPPCIYHPNPKEFEEFKRRQDQHYESLKNCVLFKDAVQSVCKQRLCLHFGIQNIEFYSTTIYIFMILEYNKLSRDNNQALQEHKMK
jgi:hypothetical protein